MASRVVGPSSFHILQTTTLHLSPEALDQVIKDTQQTIEDVKQDKKVAATLPPDERTTFLKQVDSYLEFLEKHLESLTSLRDKFDATGHRIDSLTAQFNEHRTAHLAYLKTFKTDLRQVHKSDKAFSATLQQTKFSFPTSSNTYPATSPMGFMIASPAERTILAAEQRWRDRVKKLPPEEQEEYHNKVDKVRDSLQKQYGAQASSSSSGTEPPQPPRPPGEPDPLDRSIEIIDKVLKWQYPDLPLEGQ